MLDEEKQNAAHKWTIEYKSRRGNEILQPKKKWKSWQENWNTAKWRDIKLAENRGSCRKTPLSG